MIMKTTIKSVARDQYKDSVLNEVINTGKVKVTINSDIDIIQRNVDDDGVVEFIKAKAKTFKMKSSAFSAQVRNNVPETWCSLVSYFLDANKELSAEKYMAQLSLIMNGATCIIDAELQQSDDSDEDSHEVYFYTISDIELSSMAKLIIGSKFCREVLFMTDMNEIKAFVSTLD